MLQIEKKNSPLHWLLVVIISAITATITTLVMLTILGAWTLSLCGEVPVSDYASGRAPAKCQTLWLEGRI